MAYQDYRYRELPESVVPYPQHRKMKRTVPDSDKDERYWEKRKRNNMAAKKSRENKRIADAEMRKTVLLLEQENALLKKEVALLKAEIGIPNGHSVLTAEQRSECLQQVTHHADGFKKEIDYDAPSPGCKADDTQCDTYLCANAKNSKCNYEENNDKNQGMKDYNCSMKKMSQQLSTYNSLSTMFWGGHLKYPSNTSFNSDIYTGANFPYFLPYAANRCNKTCDSEETSSAIDHNSTGNRKLYTEYCNYVNDVTARNLTSPYADDFNKHHDENIVKENQDLKRKLLLLSSQFQEMKNIACVQ